MISTFFQYSMCFKHLGMWPAFPNIWNVLSCNSIRSVFVIFAQLSYDQNQMDACLHKSFNSDQHRITVHYAKWCLSEQQQVLSTSQVCIQTLTSWCSSTCIYTYVIFIGYSKAWVGNLWFWINKSCVQVLQQEHDRMLMFTLLCQSVKVIRVETCGQ